MAVRLDHFALAAHDAQASARFLADVLDLPDPRPAGPFIAVDVDDTLTIDYAVPPFEFPGQHVAFHLSDDEFDAVRARLEERGVVYFSGPGSREPNRINHENGGRGLYFDDPGGHHFEVITRRYEGSPGR
ncbi:VOC family protein [Actinomycetospora termitidis]|uniref:VOC family protein n=1 Tax=Actinomycetospora termitidis TaxID=3053470 RepID=A0ABT7MB56_9PSEU|nr:VOC family protein [Actinomycetospora sp. Odt1-22]MDL5157894.1 VOC family protein [Actinomycetospora sp. Odt1-22]